MPFERFCENASSIAKQAMLVIAISALIQATSALAAGSCSAAPAGHARTNRGVVAPLYNQAPSVPPPVFNPSTPSTVPTTPEVPVSPASPGSVFGNGR